MLGAGRPFGSGLTYLHLTQDALTLIFLYLYTIGPKGAITPKHRSSPVLNPVSRPGPAAESQGRERRNQLRKGPCRVPPTANTIHAP